jgi:hypothetical protein
LLVTKIAYVPGGVPGGSLAAGAAAAAVAGAAGFAGGVAGFAGCAPGVAGFAGGGAPRRVAGVVVCAHACEGDDTASPRAITKAEKMRCMP